MLAGAVASYVWEHGAARGEALPGGVRSVLTTAKKLPVALRRHGEHPLRAITEIHRTHRTGPAFNIIIILGELSKSFDCIDHPWIIELDRIRDPTVVDI